MGLVAASGNLGLWKMFCEKTFWDCKNVSRWRMPWACENVSRWKMSWAGEYREYVSRWKASWARGSTATAPLAGSLAALDAGLREVPGVRSQVLTAVVISTFCKPLLRARPTLPSNRQHNICPPLEDGFAEDEIRLSACGRCLVCHVAEGQRDGLVELGV